ncbi:DUF397 domain-containing protein [Streptoalloteichus hindustanus]|uniref:DUF397 domain-containing protein n=1 Tax=Streptoalloteichus hindustanus TaxID=2017 RepID=UPI0009FE3046|nr:DUF397 domain-containing protein [Streptoalloteichus hindustanus]
MTTWRKSKYTSGNAACVEVGVLRSEVAVRDTKHRAGGFLTTSRDAWSAFVGRVRAGEFDLR